jgi:hypothetical protein
VIEVSQMDLIFLVFIGMVFTVVFGIVLAGVVLTPWLVVLVLGVLLIALLKVPVPPQSHPIEGIDGHDLDPWSTVLSHVPKHQWEDHTDTQSGANDDAPTSEPLSKVARSPEPSAGPGVQTMQEPSLTYRGHVYHPRIADRKTERFVLSVGMYRGHGWHLWHHHNSV